MSDLEKTINEALAKLASAHGISATPARHSEDDSDSAPVYVTRRPATVSRPASIDSRDSIAALRSTRGRDAVTKADRNLEGRYATAEFAVGFVDCYIDSVEQRSTGLKAYVLRLDTRERVWVLLDKLTDIRDSEEG